MIIVHRRVACGPPHPIGSAPTQLRGPCNVLRHRHDRQRPAQRFPIVGQHVQPSFDERGDLLAHFHRSDFFRRAGGEHFCIDMREPCIDHRHRAAVKGEGSDCRRDPGLRRRHIHRCLRPSVESGVARNNWIQPCYSARA